MRVGIALVVIVAIVALAIANFHLFITLVYLLGTAFAAIAGLRFLRNMMAASAYDRVSINVYKELQSRSLGRILYPVARLISELVVLLTWPIEILKGIYLALVGNLARKSNFVLAQGIAPVFLAPSFFTLIALSLLVGRAGHYPLKFVAICMVASAYLGLLRRVLFVNAKEEVLTRPGNPKMSFLILAGYDFLNATLGRLIIGEWAGLDRQTVGQSAYAVFSLADVQLIGRDYASLSAIFEDPATVANLLNVPLSLLGRALLDVLFYLAFIRFAWDILSAKREPKHYVAQGLANLAAGRLQHAKVALEQARDQKEALAILAGVSLLLGEFAELGRIGPRLCMKLGVPNCPEEEASIALIYSGIGQLSTQRLLDYLRLRQDQFRDPHTSTLLAFTALDLLPQEQERDGSILGPSDETLDEIFEFALSRPDRMSELYKSYFTQEDAVEEVLQFVPGTSVELLSYISLGVYVLMYRKVGDRFEEALNRHLSTRPQATEAFPEHWQQVIGMGVLQRATVAFKLSAGRTCPALETLLSDLYAATRQSELFGANLEAIVAVQRREANQIVANAAKAA